MTDGLNSYAQSGTGIDATLADELGIDGRMFKKTISTLPMTEVPAVGVTTEFDVINVNHLNEDIDASAVERYVAYSNINNIPEVKAYDGKPNLQMLKHWFSIWYRWKWLFDDHSK